MFSGGVSVSLAGAAPARGRQAGSLMRATRSRNVMHTLTVTGTNLAGGPDTGGFVMVVNVDNSGRFSEGASFRHGTVKMTVPAGHYYVTLRVTAADAAGGRISEMITRAYKIAS
jgi:hypothetical protein